MPCNPGGARAPPSSAGDSHRQLTPDLVQARLAAPDRPRASHDRQVRVADRILPAEERTAVDWTARVRADSAVGTVALSAPADRRVRGDHDQGGDDLYPTRPLRPAAVLVALVERPAGLTVLLTRRQPHLKDHAGQISFPGGRLEPSDPSEEAAALREAEEEVGLDPRLPRLIGRLDTYVTRTAFRVVPVVALVKPPFDLHLQEAEVAEAFEVPLSFVVDPANHQLRRKQWQGRERQFFVLPYENRYIWGATAGMLVNLSEVLRAAA